MQVIADSRDEVGILVQAFNEMITQIQWRDTALQQAHDELEQRVIERTAQLEAANQELEAFQLQRLARPARAATGDQWVCADSSRGAHPHMTDAAQEYLALVRTTRSKWAS